MEFNEETTRIIEEHGLLILDYAHFEVWVVNAIFLYPKTTVFPSVCYVIRNRNLTRKEADKPHEFVSLPFPHNKIDDMVEMAINHLSTIFRDATVRNIRNEAF